VHGNVIRAADAVHNALGPKGGIEVPSELRRTTAQGSSAVPHAPMHFPSDWIITTATDPPL
jgi:hypothetical protein